MRGLIKVLPSINEIITDAIVMRFYNKHTISDENGASYKIKIPIFQNGNLEHFLMFLIAFNKGLESMGLLNNPEAYVKHYRYHTHNKAKSKFNDK